MRPPLIPASAATHSWAFNDGQVIDTLTPRTGRRSENDALVRVEPSWDRAEHPGSWRAVWAYSAKRAARDHKTLTLQENRAKAVVAGEKASRTPWFVKKNGGAPCSTRRPWPEPGAWSD